MVWLLLGAVPILAPVAAQAVREEEDVATTIKLRGYDCPGRVVHDLTRRSRSDGGREVEATCSNGRRFRITVDGEGRLRVTPLR
ncbi:MAG: hypothetical protein D6682_00910 [Zetaproteobacteria bacterium]|nr:MAG: hypothetical protein D6682_00910 [Zetaproteobacteria bacterium]